MTEDSQREETAQWVRSWPLLLISAFLLIGGGAAYLTNDGDPLAAVAAIAAGLMTLGGFIATEVITWHHRLHNKEEER